jgi:pilus assembly protein CpaB
MQNKGLLFLLLAMVFGGMAAYMVKNAMNQQETTTESTVALQVRPVVVAAADLPVGTVLEPVHLKVVDFTLDSFPQGSYATTDELMNSESAPIVVVGMSSNEVLLPTKLSIGALRRGLTTKIPDGLRAIAIPVNDVRGVGGFVLPGDVVDVLHTTTVGRRDDQPVSRTLIQGITVLGIDQRSDEADDDPIVVKVVTLLVTPQQAKALTLSQQVGHLTLSLRNEGDKLPDDTTTVALTDLWTPDPTETRTATAPLRRASPRLIQIIRGLEVIAEPVSQSSATNVVSLTVE